MVQSVLNVTGASILIQVFIYFYLYLFKKCSDTDIQYHVILCDVNRVYAVNFMIRI